MTTTTKTITEQVLESINRIYDISATYEYPGFIAIPERLINDDVDASYNVWTVGQKGGKARSAKKTAAARLNGRKGGRPRKVPAILMAGPSSPDAPR